MKRCFMTGKQCIFSSIIAEKTAISKDRKKNGAQRTDDDLNLFIIMPFRPNIETFYQWSLKPFLIENGLKHLNIRKSDEVTDMGYIVCEKICKKIQESDLVFADISIGNTNVFYEIWLAYGLGRPVILLQERSVKKDLFLDPRVRTCISYNKNFQHDINEKILRYHGLENLGKELSGPLEKSIIEPFIQKNMKMDLKISVLDFSPAHLPNKNTVETPEITDDITLDFHGILKGACTVAMKKIKAQLDSNETQIPVDIRQQIKNNIESEKDDEQDNGKKRSKEKAEEFPVIQTIKVDGIQGFDHITQQIGSSFCTVIDVTPDQPESILAYFWLGYCHARGCNVIPVFKMKNKDDLPKISSKLAFDIRSLWFADYYADEAYKFEPRIREILEYLLIRDLPDRQKRDFWNLFPPEKEIKVFTGAIHANEQIREVVGDWDVRTVSEIFSYLPMIRETRPPQLVTPFHSPEEAFNQFKRDKRRETGLEITDKNESGFFAEFINIFNNDLDEQLRNCNAIVVASPDVNPVAEFLLNKISRSTSENCPHQAFQECMHPNFNGYVVVKEKDNPSELKFKRMFYLEKKRSLDAQPKRGFFEHKDIYLKKENDIYLQDYYNQDEDNEDFSLLGHLLVARYPPQEDGNFVILLNGVSGPATFALAQILTGGGHNPTGPYMNTRSESMLKAINKRLVEPNCIGVQGIVKISLKRDHPRRTGITDGTPASGPVEKRRYITNVDSRRVDSWEWFDEDHPQSIFK
ncbi:hypothetical protein [uncultured Methanoregula sp.]|uniref:hypothetical protein n=1 Tax=uncultured Methanoregula sp. TaxID=1005933 RepID=UPI002AABCDF8|nr:hypothetical protein [uncultured Methanoregula sp.]